MMKRILSTVLLATLLISCMTGCGVNKETISSEISNSANISNEEVAPDDESVITTSKDATPENSATQVEQSSIETTNSAVTNRPETKHPNLSPNTNLTHDDGVEFHLVTINGEEYDVSKMYGKDINISPNFIRKYKGTTEEFGYDYYFVAVRENPLLYAEFLDENDELFTNPNRLSVWRYEERKIYGLKFSDVNNAGYVTFAQGIQLGMDKKDVETILGKGYTLPDGSIAYKTPLVTFITKYVTKENAFTTESGAEKTRTYLASVTIVCNE